MGGLEFLSGLKWPLYKLVVHQRCRADHPEGNTAVLHAAIWMQAVLHGGAGRAREQYTERRECVCVCVGWGGLDERESSTQRERDCVCVYVWGRGGV